ncbi:MAG: hypothetical protein ACFCD0_11790, partial [Gemmataceae bacterium]
LVGERMDCAGMRWIVEKAEALFQLRCIELNGDWEKFTQWFDQQTQQKLRQRERVKILTDEPLTLKRVA